MNISKSRGSWSAAMPMPLSRTRITACAGVLFDGQPHVAAAVGELARVVQKVTHHLRQSRRVGIDDRSAASGSVTVSSWFMLL